ncbi:MAG: AAA family ATPase [Syntrophobacterales bacterium]|nr:AAA family ATPase [Syntrophobacterales bacterium]
MIESPTLPPLIAALLKRARQEHGAGKVELLETHISWVLLAGDYAYKIKKPVKLPFVDYSSLKARRAFCEAELMLNSRYAPDIYLGLEAIAGTPAAPRFGETPAIEWAVKMRRFDEKWRMDHVCARGELTPAIVSDLVQTVAAFHAAAQKAPPGSRFGEADQVLALALENFEELRSLLPTAEALLAKLEGWTRIEFARRQTSFAARKRAGHIRECHGDLHLGNIVLLDGRAVPFDCIEFNEDLRWVDQASELAFTYEDLLDHGQPGLANWLISEWLAATGDFEALGVLPFYAVYRALVRAKVAALGSNVAEACEYLAMATRLSARPQPTLAITHGLSGSGKTTLSSALLLGDKTANTVRIRSDVERKRLFGLAPENVGGNIYTEEATNRTYRRLEKLAEDALSAGWSVIVDAAFLRRIQREQFRNLAGRLYLSFKILACEAPPDELCRRLRARQNDASDATVAVLEQQLKFAEALTEEER